MNTLLQLKTISVTYPGASHSSVESISFSLEPYSITALIGPNGSGKSTLLRAILGFIPHTGSIQFNGKPMKEQLHLVGYVPQRFQFDTSFPITVSEFLHLSCADQNFDHEIEELLTQVKMDGKKNAQLSELSGGQLQRILLARSLLRDPQLLILDEPEAGIDAGGEQSFYSLLNEMVKAKKLTVLIATHELDIVYSFARQVVCINRTMVCSGPPQKALNEDMFTKLYGHGLQFYGHHH